MFCPFDVWDGHLSVIIDRTQFLPLSFDDWQDGTVNRFDTQTATIFLRQHIPLGRKAKSDNYSGSTCPYAGGQIRASDLEREAS
jgi:hypothetical protein